MAGPSATWLTGAIKPLFRLYIANASGSMIDRSAFLIMDSLSWSEDVAQPIKSIKFSLLRERDGTSLNPEVNSNIAEGRKFRLEYCVLAAGSTATPSYTPWFEGVIDEIDPAGLAMQIAGRDWAGKLMQTQAMNESTYGSNSGAAINTVMQAIINEYISGFTIYTLETPTGTLLKPKFKLARKSVWDACYDLVNLIGWDFRYYYQPSLNAFRLTFFNPHREQTTADYLIPRNRYGVIRQFKKTWVDVRNDITVGYGTAENRRILQGEDSVSISKYGRIAARIDLPSSSLIDTDSEAQVFLTAALNDVSIPRAIQEVEMPLNPWVQLYDLIEFEANLIYPTNKIMSVIGYSHTATKTTIRCIEQSVIGNYKYWLKHETGKTGVNPSSNPIPSQPDNFVLSTGLEALNKINTAWILATWSPNALFDAETYELKWRKDGATDWTSVEVRGTTYKVVPVESGILYEFELLVYNKDGTPGEKRTDSITSAVDTTPPAAPTGLIAIPGTGRTVNLSWTGVADPDFAYYQIARRGTSGTPLEGEIIAKEDNESYFDSDTAQAATYYYYVRAVDSAGNASGWSIGASVTTGTNPVGAAEPLPINTVAVSVVSHTPYSFQKQIRQVAKLSISSIPSDSNRAAIAVGVRPSGSSGTFKPEVKIYNSEIVSGSTTIDIYDLIPGDSYELELIPESMAGIDGIGRTFTWTVPLDTTAPNIPTGLSANALSVGTIKLAWTNPTDGDFDEIFVYMATTNSFASATKIAETTGNTHIDSSTSYGQTRYYWVVAVDIVGNMSSPSTGASAVVPSQSNAPDTSKPNSFAGLTYSTSGSSTVISDGQGGFFARKNFAGATIPADSKRAYFFVRYRKTSDAEGWIQGPSDDKASGAYDFILTDLITGAGYTVEVIPVSYYGVWGDPWTGTFTAASDSSAPATPTGVVATGILKGIAVTWSPASELDYAETQIDISTSSSFASILKTLRVTGSRVEFGDLVAGTTYYARCKHFDYSGNSSGFSTAASAVASKVTGPDVGDGAVDTPQISDGAVNAIKQAVVTSSTFNSTTGAGTATMPSMTLTFTLEYAAKVQILFSGVLGIKFVGASTNLAYVYIRVDGTDVRTGLIGGNTVDAQVIYGQHAIHHQMDLAAGSHTISIMWGNTGSATMYASYRELSVTALYKGGAL